MPVVRGVERPGHVACCWRWCRGCCQDWQLAVRVDHTDTLIQKLTEGQTDKPHPQTESIIQRQTSVWRRTYLTAGSTTRGKRRRRPVCTTAGCAWRGGGPNFLKMCFVCVWWRFGVGGMGEEGGRTCLFAYTLTYTHSFWCIHPPTHPTYIQYTHTPPRRSGTSGSSTRRPGQTTPAPALRSRRRRR